MKLWRLVGGGQALSAYLRGVEVRIISGLVNTVPFQLWARPELSQLKDLKGKLIANTPAGTSLNLATSILLMRAGLDPVKDVKLIAFGRIQLVSRALLGGVVGIGLAVLFGVGAVGYALALWAFTRRDLPAPL